MPRSEYASLIITMSPEAWFRRLWENSPCAYMGIDPGVDIIIPVHIEYIFDPMHIRDVLDYPLVLEMTDYTDIDTGKIYRSTTTYSGQEAIDASRAVRWVESENIMEIRAVTIKWFNMMESGEAATQYPDPFDTTISQDDADKLVHELDLDFDAERYRYKNIGVTAGPGFERLSASARLAFAQEFFSVLKSREQLEAEAQQRLSAGEQIPPAEYKNTL